MANFCEKCGSRLDLNTGRCPRCSVSIPWQSGGGYCDPQDYVEQEPPRGRPFLAVFISLLIIAFLAVALLFALSYFDIYTVPFAEIVFESLDIETMGNRHSSRKDGEEAAVSEGTENELFPVQTQKPKQDRDTKPTTPATPSPTEPPKPRILGTYNPGDVPPDAVEFNGHRYKLFINEGINDWDSAARYCNSMNGYLASIGSAAENSFLYNYMRQQGYMSAYFGLSDAASEGHWAWQNAEAVTYLNWNRAEPNSDLTEEDYAQFYCKYVDGTWNDNDFSRGDLGTAAVAISRISASSTLVEGQLVHSASRLIDGDLNTAWSEANPGTGEGEEISIILDDYYRLSGLNICGGYVKTEKLFSYNARPAKITITFSDGRQESFRLNDTRAIQTLYFSQPIATCALTITIDEVYAGSQWEDLVISEISLIQDSSGAIPFICEWGEYEAALR